MNLKKVHIKCHFLLNDFVPNSTGCFWDLLTHVSGRMGNAEGAFYTQVESTNSGVTSVDNSVKVTVGDTDGIGLIFLVRQIFTQGLSSSLQLFNVWHASEFKHECTVTLTATQVA